MDDDSPETKKLRAKRDKSKRTKSESVGQVPQPVPSAITSRKNSNLETDGGDHCKTISEWLAKLIGYDPVMGQMEKYAYKSMENALHSVDKIVNSCKATDVAKFNWMRKFHKRDVIIALLNSESVADDDLVDFLPES